MSSQVTSLSFDTSSNIRITFINNEPYFCLVDICNILQLSNPTHIVNQIKEEFELSTLNVASFDTGYGIKELTLISKKQLYFVMMRSRSPIAKKFRAWVYDVVEKLEKDGVYAVTSNNTNLSQEVPKNYLSQRDLITLKNIVYRIGQTYRFTSPSIYATWAALRAKTGVHQKEIEYKHLNTIIKELQRLINVSEYYNAKSLELEAKIFKEVFRCGDKDYDLDELIEKEFKIIESKISSIQADCIKDIQCLVLLGRSRSEVVLSY